MIYTKKDFRDKVNQLLDEKYFEGACFLIIEGLSLLDEEWVEEYDCSDDEVLELMEN